MNYYDLLEIKPTASEEVIKMAYKALAKKYHPDNYAGTPDEAAQKMAQINEAYDILSDREKRAEYDRKILSEKNQADYSASQPKTSVAQASSNVPRHKPGIISFFIGGIVYLVGSLLKIICTIVIIFLIAGLLTGNLKSWSGTAFYYGTAVLHTIRNLMPDPKYDKASAEYAISQYIKALYDGDAYTAQQYIDTSNLSLLNDTTDCADAFRKMQSEQLIAFMFNDMSNADYTIKLSKKENYTHSVLFITYDYQLILEKALNELYDVTDETESIKTLKSILYQSPKNLKSSVDFTMEMEDGSWLITDCDFQSLLYAMTGNLLKSFTGDTGYTYW